MNDVIAITIDVGGWILYFLFTWLALSLADTTLILFKRYIEWKIKKHKKDKGEKGSSR
tara:strand:+ start:470 stop:643 length:174 start_codon:yes stop_codon:yes gene_type:complete